MIKFFVTIILCLVSVLTVWADPRWKMHTTFDGEIDNIFETPDYVYFTSRALKDYQGQRRMSLFRYDKAGDELQTLSTDNVLSSNTISLAQYCPQKGYVVVVNTNFDITFIYDDGRVATLPDYRLATLDYSKDINSITIDPWHNRLYLATKFGYVALNDEKYEIAESRIYGEEFKSVARVGDSIILSDGNNLYYAKATSPRLSLSDYEIMAIEKPNFDYIAPLSENDGLLFNYLKSPYQIGYLNMSGEHPDYKLLATPMCYNVSNNKSGVIAATKDMLLQFEPGGVVTQIGRPESDYNLTAGSYDLSEIWNGCQRKGINSERMGNAPSDWVVTRDYMMPNAPSPFVTPEMVMHPTYGVLVPTYGRDYNFDAYPQSGPLLLSGYKDGWWTNYAPAYTNPERANILLSTNGLAVDPDRPDYVYMTSTTNGIIRLNLQNGEDIIHMSKPTDKDKDSPDFVVLVEEQVGKNKWSCNFSAPRFDSYGNLWMDYADMDNQTPTRIHLFCWEAADRQATTSAADIRLPKRVEVEYDFSEGNVNTVLPLKYASNRNKLIFSTRGYGAEFAIIDTKGTPTDGSDDEVVAVKTFQDQNGNKFEPYRIRYIWEDPTTGYVWVCHAAGVFYFNPTEFVNGSTGPMYRIKVAREDGTNLADYLLNEVIVNCMTTDGKGRKWFATGGGGLICTTSDGRIIEEELNTSNSSLPSDNVYGLMYLPESNSMLISTSEGLAEYYLTAAASGSSDGDLKIYPNPVRPDYFGYVTIEGLPDRSLVKIMDASGNIVKELGPVSGDVQWDVTNHQFKRVSSGVYFVLVSSGTSDNTFSTVGKIMVIN